MQVTSEKICAQIGEVLGNEPITEVSFGVANKSSFKVTTSEAIHLLFDEIGKHIAADRLRVLRI